MALENYYEALKMAKELGNKNSIAIRLGNIGVVYDEQGNYPKALESFFAALKMDKELGDKNGIAIRLGNIGIVYDEQGNYPMALENYYEALKMAKELGNKNNIAAWIGNIGSLYTKLGQFNKAEQYLDSALALCDSIGALNYSMYYEKNTSQLYDTLAQLAESGHVKTPNFGVSTYLRLAYTHYKKYSAAKDTIFNEEKSKKIGGLEAQHEWEMDALEKAKQEEERSRQETVSVGRRDMLQYAVIVLLFTLLLLTLLNSRRLLARIPEQIKVSRKGAMAQRVIAINKHAFALGLLFATIFIFFETLLIYFDTDIETLTQNKVVYKTLLSCLFAGTVSIVYYFSEKRMAMTLGFSFKHEEHEVKHKEHERNTMGTKFFTLFFIFFLSAFVFFLSAFVFNTDSLNAELQKDLHDTTRINTLNALGWEFRNTNPDTSIILSSQSLSLAQKSKWQKGIANSYHNLAEFNRIKGNYPLSLEYSFKSLTIRKNIKDRKGIATSLGNIGNVYYNQGNSPKALENYFKALKMDKELGNKNGITRHLGNIGIVYHEQGNYSKALENYFEALKMAKELDDKNDIARHLGDIGIVYRNQGNYPKALESYFEALKMDKELGNKKGIARHLGNIGIVYDEQGNYPKALENYFEALKMDKELGNKNDIATDLSNIGIVYKEQGNYPKALENYSDALKIDKELRDKNGIAIDLGNIGLVYTKLGQFNEAEQYLDSALVLSTEIGDLNSQKDLHEMFTNLYDTLAQLAESGHVKTPNLGVSTYLRLALTHYKKYDTVKDTLFNEEKSKEIGKLETRHKIEIEDFERQKKAEQSAETARIEKEREDKIGYSLVMVGFFGVLALTLLLSRLVLPPALIQIATTIPFLLLFETAIVFMNPYIEQFSGNAPGWKLAFNFLLALLLYPLHEKAEQLLERTFRRKRRGKVGRGSQL